MDDFDLTDQNESLAEVGDGGLGLSSANPDAGLMGAAHGRDERRFWMEQSENGLCVPVSVAIVLKEFGLEVTEQEITETAAGQGWLEGGPGNWKGMEDEGAEKLLEHYGVEAHVDRGTVADLERYLDANHGIILAVDSSEISFLEDDDGSPEDKGADHALVVTQIDEDRGTVTLNNPGDPRGQGYELSLAKFEDAWADSGNTMIVTDSPAGASQEPRGPAAPQPGPAPQPPGPTAPQPPTPPQPQPAPTGPLMPGPPRPDGPFAPGQVPPQPHPAGQPFGEPRAPLADPGGIPPSEKDLPAADGPDHSAPKELQIAGFAGMVLLPIYVMGRDVMRDAQEQRRKADRARRATPLWAPQPRGEGARPAGASSPPPRHGASEDTAPR